ncbi:putative microsomal signal peptidase subunit SPC12 [Aspergillus avenaceus]|uniref:Signal peptidase complex subunit 1 n=1 Tax=Aspergillus avenaceus TaxID=36643 RepID=A0A5N6TPL7_ASPAV|nr:putative microsomal signal peptidase subunit SPC12 [Aspergillus avenaceus]
MNNFLTSIQDVFEGQIDFHGQRIAELLSTAFLIVSGVAAFLTGYIYQDIHLTLWVGLWGTLTAGLTIIPSWPIYNRNPEKWLVTLAGSASSARVMVDGVKVI